ncbi:MAG: hypothetical protein ACK452_09775, partial [Bacteroidota bacterium]
KYLHVDSSDLYPIGFKIDLKELNFFIGDHLLLKMKTNGKCNNPGQLFFNLSENDSTLFFSHSVLKTENNCNTFYTSMFLGDNLNKSGQITAALCNNSKSNFRILEFDLFLIRLNPYRYALLEDFKK